MLIKRNLAQYIVFSTESIFKALEKISANQKRVVFVVDEDGTLAGSFSDGDFRRWITSAKTFDLSKEVSEVMNRKALFKKVSAATNEISAAFTPSIDVIPLVDDYQRLVAVALQKERGITIGKHTISEKSPAYVIAEIGNNHNGSLELALRLIDLAAEAGADCVKFQMRDLGSLYKSGGKKDQSADLGAQYTMDLLAKFQLSNDDLIKAFDHCKARGLTPMCTPWDIKSLEVLEAYGMEAYKVASADFTNHQLLAALAATGKPLICSTGMCTESEIKASVDFLKSKGTDFVVLHCNSTYPTPFKDVNLAYIKRMQEITGALVGYSGHERGISVPVAAVTLGARVVEKHFTVDKGMEGNDHKVSLLPHEFKEMVRQIREVEESMGDAGERKISQGEMMNREVLAKSLVVNRRLRQGEVITREMIDIKSPGQGLQPLYIEELIGKKAKRDMEEGDFFYESDLKEEASIARPYSFRRPFGIPVRYHDYGKLVPLSNFDFVEFHLSYQDMELNPADFFTGPQSIGFAVHSPELFAGDHILDLASKDPAYRAHSIAELNRVCDVTRSLKPYFPKTERPVIVVNAGGFNTSGFLPKSERPAMYAQVAESLAQVNQDGVEIIIQTMPPFPWHFGGQSYHNLFMMPDEMVEFYQQHGYRICYDVSHTMMACNYFQLNLSEVSQAVGGFTAHLHISDAKGTDGEGVQMGTGDIDFAELARDLQAKAPNIQFIPEIWQGHKNKGEGFWHALDILERQF